MDKKQWPYNSELFVTIREIRRELSKLSFANNIRITKPIKPRLLIEYMECKDFEEDKDG